MSDDDVEEVEDRWIDSHSVGCYFCGRLFDEREGINADEFNGGDGGSVCPDCLLTLKKNDDYNE